MNLRQPESSLRVGSADLLDCGRKVPDSMPKQRRIAIVDDDSELRTALARLVAALGFRPTVYDSAEAFISMGADPYPDCMITDYHMPGESGLGLVEHVRAASGELPIIMVTAFDEHALEEKCKRLRIPLLKKPVSASELRNAIEQALSVADTE